MNEELSKLIKALKIIREVEDKSKVLEFKNILDRACDYVEIVILEIKDEKVKK